MSSLLERDVKALNKFRSEYPGVRPTFEQETALLKQIGALDIGVTSFINANPGNTRDLLLDRRGLLMRTLGAVPTTPYLSAVTLTSYLENIIVGFITHNLKLARRAGFFLWPDEQKKLEANVNAVCWDDARYGAVVTLGAIIYGERELRGQNEKAIIAKVFDNTLDPVQAADSYFKLQPKLKAFSTEAVRSLCDDNTGFVLLDTIVQKLNKGQQDQECLAAIPYVSSSVVSMLLAGAQMARSAFCAVYPIALQLPPPDKGLLPAR